MSLEIRVFLRPATGGEERQIAGMTITNDGTASDGSGDSEFGNYAVKSWWVSRNGALTKLLPGRVEGFPRKKPVWDLIWLAILSLGSKGRPKTRPTMRKSRTRER